MKQASLCPSQSFITEVIANYLKRSSEQTKAPRLREKGKKKCSCSPISFSNQALFLPHVRHRDQKPSLVFSTNTNVCHTASTAATIGSQKLWDSFHRQKKKKKNLRHRKKKLFSPQMNNSNNKETLRKKNLNKNSGEKALVRSLARKTDTRTESLFLSPLVWVCRRPSLNRVKDKPFPW